MNFNRFILANISWFWLGSSFEKIVFSSDFSLLKNPGPISNAKIITSYQKEKKTLIIWNVVL